MFCYNEGKLFLLYVEFFVLGLFRSIYDCKNIVIDVFCCNESRLFWLCELNYLCGIFFKVYMIEGILFFIVMNIEGGGGFKVF